jgi:carbamoyl-phosphate synthase large subunit
MSLRERKINILFTSAGRRVELLHAFRHAYQALDLVGNLVATDIDPLAPALQAADRPYIVPRATAPDYIPTLIEICQREQINLVFPLIDPDIPILADHQKVIEVTGAQVVVVSKEIASIAGDKWLTREFFQQLQIRTPNSWLPENLDPEQISFPVFIKPRCGSAAKSTFRVNNPRELDFFIDYVPDPIIQEYLPGPEITSDIVCDLDGQVLAVVSRQRIEVRWGEVSKGVTVCEPSIFDPCMIIAQELSARGPINVQCIMKDGLPYFIEINARFGGGVPLGIAAGVDSPRLLLARFAGLSISIPPLGRYATNLYLSRFDQSFFLTEEEREQVAGCYL